MKRRLPRLVVVRFIMGAASLVSGALGDARADADAGANSVPSSCSSSVAQNSVLLPDHTDLQSPIHSYWDGPLHDPFTKLLDELQGGSVVLDGSSEEAYLRTLLVALEIPVSSQTLAFSTTSLQLRFISPRNPRAIYFNENVYVGYIPGGRVEIVSLDPALGGIFYIFDFPTGAGAVPQVERSNRCMNCHADATTGHVPGLVVKSVLPGPTGGSIDSFRRMESGHGIPLRERFGGWYVTGDEGIGDHWGNRIGRLFQGEVSTERVPPGERFDWSRYPVSTSDVLAHLILEHQVGFVNLAIEATYRARTYLAAGVDGGVPSPEAAEELDRQARLLVGYLLFVDEAPLPDGGIRGDETFRRGFLASRRTSSDGLSLKDFDLARRLFLHRCSYMIYSLPFQGLPTEMKRRVFDELARALDPSNSDSKYAHLAVEEKAAIRTILAETLPGLPVGW